MPKWMKFAIYVQIFNTSGRNVNLFMQIIKTLHYGIRYDVIWVVLIITHHKHFMFNFLGEICYIFVYKNCCRPTLKEAIYHETVEYKIGCTRSSTKKFFHQLKNTLVSGLFIFIYLFGLSWVLPLFTWTTFPWTLLKQHDTKGNSCAKFCHILNLQSAISAYLRHILININIRRSQMYTID